MKVSDETHYVVEVRKVLRDGEGKALPGGDWPSVMVECDYDVRRMLDLEVGFGGFSGTCIELDSDGKHFEKLEMIAEE